MYKLTYPNGKHKTIPFLGGVRGKPPKNQGKSPKNLKGDDS